MSVPNRIEIPSAALPPGPGTLSIIEKEYTGGAQGISSTTPVAITGTQQIFALAGTQDVMFVGFASAAPNAQLIANVGFGINIDGTDYYGTLSATPNLGGNVEGGLFVSKGLSLGPGNHTVYLFAYRISGLYNAGSIISSVTLPSRWEAIFGGGADSPNEPVVGGSGTQYLTIADAILGETETRVAGVVPQAGTGPGVLVGPGTLSAVDDFYKDWIVENTDTTPTNGLVSQWARVASYVGATRTMTLDKPWDFSTESTFLLVDPVRLTLKQDITEDVIVNKCAIMDLGGNRVKGKIDVTASEFCWVRGANGFVTNGIQKADFGLLKVDKATVSRRDATIYALLMTNGSDLGRCELTDCEFMGRVAGRRGYSGWIIQNCRNYGVPATTISYPYALVESIAGVAIVLTALDVALDSQFSGSVVYSENSITGATGYVSILGSLRSPPDSINTNDGSRRIAFFSAIGGATLNVTLTSGRVLISPADVNASAELVSTGVIEQLCFLEAINFTGTCSVTMSTGGNVRCIVPNVSNGAAVEIAGTATMSGSVTLAGTDTLNFSCGLGGGVIMLRMDSAVTGSITISGGAVTMLGGSTALVVFAGNINAGAPTITISKGFTAQYGSTAFRYFIYGAISITLGTFQFSGGIFQPGCVFTANTITLGTAVSGGTWTVSGTIGITSLINGGVAQIFCEHQGTGGTITISNSVSFIGLNSGWGTIAQATGAGSTISITSTTVDLRGFTVSNTSIVRAVTATSSASVTGAITFMYCTIGSGFNFLVATAVGGVAAGPSSLLFDHCSFGGTVTSESGSGTITWAAAALRFRHCHIEGLFTIVLTRFTTVEAFFTRFSGNSSNKSITASGTRPTTFRYWKCSFAARYDDIQPEVLDVYDILPAQAALAQGQPVKVNAANQYQVCVAASVVDGIALAAAGGAGTIIIAIRQGRAYVTCKAATANGDNLVLDIVTPTQANLAAAAVVGQEIGTALEAVGAVVAGKCYSAINVR